MTFPTKKQFTSDWGPKCKDFAPLCASCIAWHAYLTLVDLYQIKEKKWKTKTKK